MSKKQKSKSATKAEKPDTKAVKAAEAISEVELKPDIEEVVKRLDRETSDHKPRPNEESEMKDKSKKVKKEKSTKKANGADHVSLSSIAKAQKVEGSELRKALRSSKIKKPGGSWTWPKGHEDIAKVEKLAKSLGK